MADKLDDRGFLQRWSARKANARLGDEGDDASLPAAVANVEPTPTDIAADIDADIKSDDAPQTPPPDLPDVETLGADSDYTGFLGENVPQDLANMAMRKLWRSDPMLANLDGLNDYDDDFSKVGMISEVVKTAYQVGKGFLTDEDEVEAVEAHDTDPDETPKSEAHESDDDAPKDEDLAANVTDEPPLEGENGAAEFHDTELIKPT